ncbi:hypothetical Protein YC6258_04921 [Gynuella sunshinyii YC6258]|uniref:Uncharacterized protein n=1 Tax=Gynuella sunshinyii YC6258 TaxID=1445510 RepID=A0A0C5VUG2_9GAMM|nr:hypothetical Protein YC6258_04921 [Gynuella sunshinyii YC6258]
MEVVPASIAYRALIVTALSLAITVSLWFSAARSIIIGDIHSNRLKQWKQVLR